MKILGLLEIRPFDGTDPFVCLRVDTGESLFDLPIDNDQLGIVLHNMPSYRDVEEDSGEYEENSVDEQQESVPNRTAYEPNNDTFVVNNSAQFTMGQGDYYDDEDDDL